MAPRGTLARRIWVVSFCLSLVVMLAVAAATTLASYATYEREAEGLLMSQAEACSTALQGETEEEMCSSLAAMPLADTRLTLVSASGVVLYDSYVDAASLGNHADREEIVEAEESGQGIVMRRSETLGTDTLYAAIQVEGGCVLRLAETRTSLASFLGGMGWQLVLLLIAVFLLSFVACRALTSMIVRPMHEIDMEDPLNNDAYEELQPLLSRVDQQRRELKSQNDELARAVTLRREFTGNVSHEMKTPLQVIGGYAELMESGMVDPEDIPKFSGLIKSESEAMRVLIDDVLTLSRLDENGGGEAEPVLLADSCRRVIDRLRPAAAERGETMEDDLDDGVKVSANPGLMDQMIYNLVDNAVKYNRQGGAVRMRVWQEAGRAYLAVSDEGPGIPEESRERVFERFYRIDESRSRETGGTGLGLAIVKHAVETFGGVIEVSDGETCGAVFKVSLPAS